MTYHSKHSTCSKKMPCPDVDATPDTRASMRQQLMAGTDDDPLQLVQYFRHIVHCVTDPPLDTAAEEIVVAGCLPKFINFLHTDRLELQVSQHDCHAENTCRHSLLK